MINRQRNSRNTLHIDHILEICLDDDVWARIVRVSIKKNVSFSWVVRYTLFRFIKIKSIEKFVLSESTQFKSTTRFHRHKLCLYGKDEILIRMTAALWGVSMTRLVQIALRVNLGRLEEPNEGSFHRIAFYWLGIKLYSDVKLHNKTPGNIQLQLAPFTKSSYW